MGKVRALFTATLLLVAGGAMSAGTADEVIASVRKNLPNRKGGVVVCNLNASVNTLNALVETGKKAGLELSFVNVGSEKDVDAAAGIISRSRPGFVILIEQDPVLGAAAAATKGFITRTGGAGVPVVGTGEALVKIGANLGPKGPKA